MDIRDNLIRIACKIASVRFPAPSANNGVLNPSFNFTDLTNLTNLHPSISALTLTMTTTSSPRAGNPG